MKLYLYHLILTPVLVTWIWLRKLTQPRKSRFSLRNLGQDILFHSGLFEQEKKKKKKEWKLDFVGQHFLPVNYIKSRKSHLKRQKMEADVDKKAAWVTHGFSSGEFCSFVLYEILSSPNIVSLFVVVVVIGLNCQSRF